MKKLIWYGLAVAVVALSANAAETSPTVGTQAQAPPLPKHFLIKGNRVTNYLDVKAGYYKLVGTVSVKTQRNQEPEK